MKQPLHILINDESIGDSQFSVFEFFATQRREFVQVKDANQFDYLIEALSPETEIAVWVHPNADAKKRSNLGTTPGEASISAMVTRKIEFNVVSRYPNDVSQEMLDSIGKRAIPLGSLYEKIDSVQTTTVARIRKASKDETSLSSAPVAPFAEVHVDVAIIAALYEDEYESMRDFLEDVQPVQGFQSMVVAKLKGTCIKVVVDFQATMGMVDAAYLSTQIVNMFSPKHLIMIGVCGGRATKGVKLLDILIPSKVFDYATGKFEQGVFKPYMRQGIIKNKKIRAASKDVLIKMLDHVPHTLKEKCQAINVHTKALACGNFVVKTDNYLENVISANDEETQGVEMESYGVVRVTELLENKHVEPIIIKAVMDYTEKDKTDTNKKDAAYFSACFTYFFVKDHLLT